MEQTTQTNNNVNEILDSVSDKIIAKRKLKRTIISSVILSAIVVLSAIIISLASISVNLQPEFLMGADAYKVYHTDISEYEYIDDEDSKKYNEFIEKYNDQFYTTILTGIFTGKLGDCKIEESKTEFYNKSGTDLNSTLKTQLGQNYIRLMYNKESEDRVLTNGNGSTYKSTEYPKGTVLKFKDCYLKLSDTPSNTMTFYVGTYPDGWGTPATITTITVKASSYGLYQYFAD
ncbi:MAG: hypothetical protein IJY90_02040 [Clostridia bacterium]|nr:hypothetical protein [Clostridia bacterium]